MGKTETMLLKNKEANAAKVETAVDCIKDMLRNDEQVVVCELVKRTGLSRAFFYNNEAVRAELDKAQELQDGKSFVAPQKVAIDKAFGEEADEAFIKEIMINGESNINRDYLRVIQEGLYNYVEDIMNSLRSLKFNSTLTQFVFIGGGATIIKNFLKEQEANITVMDDVFINAKGYEEILRHKYKVG